MALLFCNVGWMERYEGLRSGDNIVGGGSWVQDKGTGHEVCNFSVHRGKVYGYVQPPGRGIDIQRLGAGPTDGAVSGVTVVWTAARPTGGTVVVGWYRNATVFREYQQFAKVPDAHRLNDLPGYFIEAPAGQAKLLRVDERTCELPRRVKGGMGQANVWYADSPLSEPILRRVQSLMSGRKPESRARTGRAVQQDQVKKAKIEEAAIRACCNHFEALGYSVESVEKDNLGWDLEARAGKTLLHIEVKGLSGTSFSIELTPNEYRAFASRTEDYRLAVVLKALTAPELLVCRFSREEDKWLVDGSEGKSLQVEIRESASVRLR